MDSSCSNRFDIFEIYRRYSGITSRSYATMGECYREDDESPKANLSREALAQLLKFAESRVHTRMSIFDEVFKLMSRLDLMDFSEFSRFYDFVFFICRENGQKNITVSRAITAWRLVLEGRFRLLNQWCSFVESNQRHNISEDTWRQVLAFSRCVHENLEGYDPEGAWPVLIDDFVEHMYRITGPNYDSILSCNCGDSEVQPFEDSLPGLKNFPGSKRKLHDELATSAGSCWYRKRRRNIVTDEQVCRENDQPGNATDNCVDIVKPNIMLGCPKSQCAVDGCLSKGFAGLFSSRSRVQSTRKEEFSLRRAHNRRR